MSQALLREITESQLRNDLSSFEIGDTVKVEIKISEGDKVRIQAFSGVVIRKRNSKERRSKDFPGSINETFTVKCLYGSIGVERTYPINSPKIASIKVLKSGKVRRAKLYYLRSKIGKAAKLKEKLHSSKI